MNVITKSELQSYYDRGMTVAEMRDAIKNKFGEAPSVALLREQLNRFGFDLRKKPRRNNFAFVDDSTNDLLSIMQKAGYSEDGDGEGDEAVLVNDTFKAERVAQVEDDTQEAYNMSDNQIIEQL